MHKKSPSGDFFVDKKLHIMYNVGKEVCEMKKVIKSLLKAVAYLCLYVGVQGMVAVLATLYVAVNLYLKNSSIDIYYLAITVSETLTESLAWITIISSVIFVGIVMLTLSVRKPSIKENLSLKKFDKKQLIPLTIFAISSNYAVSVIFGMLIPFTEKMQLEYDMSVEMTMGGGLLETFILAVIVAPIVEEILCRGLIYTRLKQGFWAPVAGFLSSLVFGLLHGTFIWVMYATLLGLIFVVALEKTKSLYACIYLHFVFNLVGFITSNITINSTVELGIYIISIPCVIISSYLFLKNAKNIA